MTELENHVLKTATTDVKDIREKLGRVYISTVNLPDGSISNTLKEALSEQHRMLINFQSKLADIEKTINLVINNNNNP